MTSGEFNEILANLARINEATHYVLLVGLTMDFLALVITARVLWASREISRISKEIQEESRRTSYYLFGKLGPLETK